MTRHTPQWFQAGSYAASIDRDLIAALWPNGATVGLQVAAGSGMTVTVPPGKAAVQSPGNGATGCVLCTSDATETVTLPAAPASGSNRIDLIVVHPRAADWDGNVATDWTLEVVSSPAVTTPTVPLTPAGQLALASVYIPGASASVVAGNITDRRPGGLAVPGVAAGRIYPTAQTVASANAFVTVGPMAADYLRGGMALSGTTGLMVPVSGLYTVSAAITWNSGGGFVSASGYYNCFVQRNGTSVRSWSNYAPGATMIPSVGGSDLVALVAGDVLTMQGQQGSAGAQAAGTNTPATNLTTTWLSAILTSPQ